MILRSKLFLFFLLFSAGSLFSQITVNGTVLLGDPDATTIPGWPVILVTGSGQAIEAITEEDGFFSFTVTEEVAEGDVWSLQTFDLCSGIELDTNFVVSPDISTYSFILLICEGINPPPPPDSCQAFFIADPVEGNQLTYQFTNLSSSADPIDSLLWDFGDGNTSTEDDPIHTYETSGSYTASLIIFAGGCVSTTFQLVIAFDPSDCECPEVIDPVCVIDYTGDLLAFDNECLALCAGYGPESFINCDNDCLCPLFISPICAIDDTGDTLTFTNHCFAECEGFGPDTWIECEPIDNCGCEDAPQNPVCVNFGGLQISFQSECEAICYGFTEEFFFDCDSTGACICPEYLDPVCVIDANGDTLTYDNFCFAQCDGYAHTDIFDCNEIVCDCPAGGEPVCVIDPAFGIIFSFENACIANCYGYSDDAFVDCEGGPGHCDCEPEDAPVCVQLPDGQIVPLSSTCEALCLGFTEDAIVSCENGPGNCGCEPEEEPVCVLTEDGIFYAFPSVCDALCFGFDETFIVPCEDGPGQCDCEPENEPVCVQLDDGTIIPFPSTCDVICAGFSEDAIVDCGDLPGGCVCPAVFDPVCAVSENGDTLSFQNACYAACEGFEEADLFECTDCVCDLPDFPVCYFDSTTLEVITYENACDALCEGINPDLLFVCFEEEECYADFVFSPASEDGLTINFADLSFSNTPIESWSWDFGDGATSDEHSPTHTYTEPGAYEVTLTITTADCAATTVYTIVVGESTPPTGVTCQAFFFFEQPNPEDLLTFQFISFSLGSGQSHLWDFGDGNTSLEENPLHTYAEAGTYQVSLTILGPDGCESTIAIVVNAGDNIWYGDLECRAWFLPIIIPDSNFVFFYNLSSPDAVTFAWEFGDGTTSSDFEASHQYAGPGVYTATLTITTDSGCTNSYSVTLNLGENEFTSNPVFSLISSTSEVAATNAPAVSAAPNPTRDLVRLSWTGRSTGTYNWTLVDLNGRTLRTGTGRLNGGTEQFDVNLVEEPAGIYFLRLQTPDGSQTLKLSKQR